MKDAIEKLMQVFKTFKKNAWRVETLPIYKIEGGEWEEFEKYREGVPIAGFANQGWIDQISAWTRSGKEIKRIRVIPLNLTEYLHYELEWCYPRNWVAGENIQLISESTYNSILASMNSSLKGDFWLFDRQRVFLMDYSKEGEFLGGRVVEDPQQVAVYVELFEKLSQRSIPFPEGMKQLRKAYLSVNPRLQLP